MPKMYKGKSMRMGGGGHFLKVVDALKEKGITEERAKAIAANAGRKKLGKAKFQKLAAAGVRKAKKQPVLPTRKPPVVRPGAIWKKPKGK